MSDAGFIFELILLARYDRRIQSTIEFCNVVKLASLSICSLGSLPACINKAINRFIRSADGFSFSIS